LYLCRLCVYFFFQAEDGIRDRNVTGVQTCALPISVSMLDQPKKVRTAAGLAPLDSAIDAARLRRSWKLRSGAACLMSRLAALPSVSTLYGSPPAATTLPPVSGSR